MRRTETGFAHRSTDLAFQICQVSIPAWKLLTCFSASIVQKDHVCYAGRAGCVRSSQALSAEFVTRITLKSSIINSLIVVTVIANRAAETGWAVTFLTSFVTSLALKNYKIWIVSRIAFVGAGVIRWFIEVLINTCSTI